MQRALALLLVFAVCGCFEAAAPSRGPSGDAVPHRTLLVSGATPVLDDGFMGELSGADWNETWTRYANGISPRPLRPLVDHAQERIFAVSLGPFGTNCHDVRVVNVTWEIGAAGVRSLVIWYDTYSGEGEGRLCGSSVAWPTHVVAVRTDSYARFERLRTVGPSEAWHPSAQSPQPERLAVETIDRGSFSGFKEDARLVIRDGAAWDALWTQHRPAIPPPAVDFTQAMVLAVIVHGPTGCAAMHLGDVIHDPSVRITEVEVVLEYASPAIRCFVAFEDVFEFARVPIQEGDVRFFDRQAGPEGDSP